MGASRSTNQKFPSARDFDVNSFTAVRKLRQRLRFVRHCRFVLSKPRHRDTLIYDRSGSEFLLQILNPEHTEILDIRGESLNVRVLLKMLLGRKNSLYNYACEYIRFVNPNFVITFTDTDTNFYRLKSDFPKITTIAIQNGIRSNLGPRFDSGFFDLLQRASERVNLSVDYMCLLGNAIGSKYQPWLNAQFISVGGLRNNSVKLTHRVSSRKSIRFISQYPPAWTNDSDICLYYRTHPMSFSTFYEAEGRIVKSLAQYCNNHGLEFAISGKRDQLSIDERDFFSRAIGSLPWTFIPRKTSTSSYESLEPASVIVTIDSTLGYEFLARGFRTAFFSIRGTLISNRIGVSVEDLNFGWPQQREPHGPFWTNTASESEFVRVLDYLTTVEDNEWTREIGKYTGDLMVFDQGNTVLRGLLQRLGAKLIEQGSKHA